jgi:putative NADH-flavin reductase
MRIAVIGAAGRTGRLVVEQALERGHEVIALARTPSAITVEDPKLTVSRADVLAPDGLADVIAGADAIVSAVGTGTSRAPTRLYSDGARNELAAMAAAGVARLAAISAAPAGPRDGLPFAQRRIVMPLLDRLFGAAYEDMRRMEAVLRESDVDWIAVRPPRLVGKPPTGAYRVGIAPLPKARSITHADLASALLDVLDRDDLYRRAVYVAN